MTKASEPTATQAEVLARIYAAPTPEIWRMHGGWWTVEGTPIRYEFGYWTPSWSVDVRTVQAMERQGWLERAHQYPEAWRDTRIPTPEGYRWWTALQSGEWWPTPKRIGGIIEDAAYVRLALERGADIVEHERKTETAQWLEAYLRWPDDKMERISRYLVPR